MTTTTYSIEPSASLATQIVLAGEGPVLITNTDLSSTIYIGESATIKSTDQTGIVPIEPNGSIAVDGKNSVYAIATGSNAVIVSTITGGVARFRGLTSGLGQLVLDSIRSSNYDAGSSGWSIFKAGNVEFNDGIFRGTITASVFEGTNFEITSNGAFFYSSTPALGNLIYSVTNAAGTDSYGNAYLEGSTSYIHILTPASRYIAGNFNGATFGLYISLTEGGPYSLIGDYEYNLVGSASALQGMVIKNSGSGALFTVSDYADAQGNPQFIFNGPLYIIDPNNSSLVESWHNISLTLAGWGTTSGSVPLQVRKLATNTFKLMGDVSGTAIASSPVTLGSLPGGYYPTGTNWAVPSPVSIFTGSIASGQDNPIVQIDTSGDIKLYNCKGATRLSINYDYSLDFNI